MTARAGEPVTETDAEYHERRALEAVSSVPSTDALALVVYTESIAWSLVARADRERTLTIEAEAADARTTALTVERLAAAMHTLHWDLRGADPEQHAVNDRMTATRVLAALDAGAEGL